MSTKYKINLEWSERDGAWLASVPELPGCMADGETPQEALQEVEAVIGDWIDEARRLGRVVPAPMPSIDSLAAASPLLNMAAVARTIGVEPRTLRARLTSKTPLRSIEAERIKTEFAKHQLVLL